MVSLGNGRPWRKIDAVIKTGWKWTTLFLLVATRATAQAPAEDPWWGKDKALHLGVSAGLAAGGYGLGGLWWKEAPPRLALGAGVALSAGLFKELSDLASYGHFSYKDLAWDGVGAAVGLTVSWLVHQLLFPSSSSPSISSNVRPGRLDVRASGRAWVH
jgi:uncharacterized protein YfiM (DUF2279 family)